MNNPLKLLVNFFVFFVLLSLMSIVFRMLTGSEHWVEASAFSALFRSIVAMLFAWHKPLVHKIGKYVL